MRYDTTGLTERQWAQLEQQLLAITKGSQEPFQVEHLEAALHRKRTWAAKWSPTIEQVFEAARYAGIRCSEPKLDL